MKDVLWQAEPIDGARRPWIGAFNHGRATGEEAATSGPVAASCRGGFARGPWRGRHGAMAEFPAVAI
jgi:hypothetical protein